MKMQRGRFPAVIMDVAGVGVKWAKLMQHKTVSLKVEAMEVNFTEETSEMLKISSVRLFMNTLRRSWANRRGTPQRASIY